MTDWREQTRHQLARLPEAARQTARIYENGEVAWPNEHAAFAIEALADAGFLILGLDARTHHPDGSLSEVPVSDYSPGLFYTGAEGLHRGAVPRVTPTPEARRDAALNDVDFAAAHGDFVLITFSPPEDPMDAKH